MKQIQMRSAVRAAVAALALVLAACDGGDALRPRMIADNWFRSEQLGPADDPVTVQERLELGRDGRFTWTTVHLGAAGREGDRMQSWLSRSGEWRLRRRSLELRTLTGLRWQPAGGWTQLDYAGEWRMDHAVRLEDDDRLVLTEVGPFVGPPGYEPSPLVFRRVPKYNDPPLP